MSLPLSVLISVEHGLRADHAQAMSWRGRDRAEPEAMLRRLLGW